MRFKSLPLGEVGATTPGEGLKVKKTCMKLPTTILLTVTMAVAAAGQDQRFTAGPNLADARLAHTATLLPDGRVFVAGGGEGPDLIDGFWVVPGAEIFDPAAGTFSTAGVSARDGHTATLLQSGQVLLAGGETGWCECSPYGTPAPIVSPSAELYDPVTGKISPTGSMNLRREFHTATLLKDGRVLIAGGYNLDGLNWVSQNSAEIYDPVTGTFSMTGSLNEPRVMHTATLLPDGRALITGGYGDASLATAEIYDPATGMFTPTGNMNLGRANHDATLLNNSQVLLTGGSIFSGSLAAELYDPTTGSFALTGNMTSLRHWHTSTLLQDGTVLIAGGFPFTAQSTAELYDPATGEFGPAGTSNPGRFMHSATLLSDGSVLVIGGAKMDNPPYDFRLNILSSTEIYSAH
jgi:hypothetical protein